MSGDTRRRSIQDKRRWTECPYGPADRVPRAYLPACLVACCAAAFVRDLVLCLGKLLLAQEVSTAAWNSPALLKAFFVLLTYFREK